MKLSARQVDTAKPYDKDYKLPDGNGLFLLVKTNGAKYWRWRYTFAGKERLLALGVYPSITLANARDRRDEAKKLLAQGVDPVRAKAANALLLRTQEVTFEDIALEWYDFKKTGWGDSYTRDVMRGLENNIFPWIGKYRIDSIEPVQVLDLIRAIERRGATSLSGKVRRWCSEIFSYAVATGRAKYNPVSELHIALRPHFAKIRPHLTANELPAFLTALDGYERHGGLSHLGLKILILSGLRTHELRHSRWAWVDFDQGLWEIPAEFMKMRRPHIVPLSRQLVELLRELHQLTGRYENMFPKRGDPTGVMDKMVIGLLIYRLGYKGRVVGHGFRHTLSTILNGQGFNPDWIELQLAHRDGNKIRGIYNHALYLDGRREMMQWYADHIDHLRRQGVS
ncbi:tyrosine-type recombinase/integrase [Kosakonia sp. 1610]|uniref:tyrosine-type recombinase/integrase n=1 Tax=Kosakonia sp. 1610 TaxID=3156426 RepID=UPI003D251261